MQIENFVFDDENHDINYMNVIQDIKTTNFVCISIAKSKIFLEFVIHITKLENQGLWK